VAKFCDESSDRIPVGFVLGFYVSLVVSRFWQQLNALPWPGRMALVVTAFIHNKDTKDRDKTYESRILRRNIMRYFALAYTLTMRHISPPVRKRFPTLSKITKAGMAHRSYVVYMPCDVQGDSETYPNTKKIAGWMWL